MREASWSEFVITRLIRGAGYPAILFMAALPSVLLGFLGMLVLAPALREALDLPTGLTALAGAVLLAGISLPTIVSIAEDALDAVPRSYRGASLALGATDWP